MVLNVLVKNKNLNIYAAPAVKGLRWTIIGIVNTQDNLCDPLHISRDPALLTVTYKMYLSVLLLIVFISERVLRLLKF